MQTQISQIFEKAKQLAPILFFVFLVYFVILLPPLYQNTHLEESAVGNTYDIIPQENFPADLQFYVQEASVKQSYLKKYLNINTYTTYLDGQVIVIPHTGYEYFSADVSTFEVKLTHQGKIISYQLEEYLLKLLKPEPWMANKILSELTLEFHSISPLFDD